MKFDGNCPALYTVAGGKRCATKRGSSPFGTRLSLYVRCNFIPITRQELKWSWEHNTLCSLVMEKCMKLQEEFFDLVCWLGSTLRLVNNGVNNFWKCFIGRKSCNGSQSSCDLSLPEEIK
ncbi:hypothetical protein OUZ56_003469 [Daphnia magna]|uniref:Uncharacterized protein n=1 Tax=Daphnia magna TaxID=35525 RepID=A0ABR0A8V5_9CRUS|nr:hypothetical protein OUZ56_003469 [Daphnia magna]